MDLTESDLALLRTAMLFDLTTLEGRKDSVARLRSLFYRLHEILQPRTVFEIGAKEATFSRTIRKISPRSRAVAFEANPHVYAKQRKEADPKRDGVDYRHMAVCDTTGTTKFFVQVRRGGKAMKATVGSNSLMPRLGDVETREVEVPCTRIDDFLTTDRFKHPLSAWIDVEGAIGVVLPGMESVLSEFLMVFCEVEERPFWDGQWTWPKVHRFMVKRGFVAVARDFEFDGQNNVLFLHRDAFKRDDVRKALVEYYGGVRHPVEEVRVVSAVQRAAEADEVAKGAGDAS
jgi:FkbM family methyltransferase